MRVPRPPRETFGELVPAASAHMRMRLSPDVSIGMGLRVKQPGERMVGDDVELILTEQDGGLPCRRTSGCSATRCTAIGDLFGREDIVDAQWRIVEPILDNVTPLYHVRARKLGSGRGRAS